MSAIWESKTTSGSDRLVLLALADNANDEGICWPSVATIARKSNLSKRYTQMILEKLLKDGHILRQQRYDDAKHKNMTNVFTVVRPVSLVNDTSLPSESCLTIPSEVDLRRVVRPASPEPSINSHIEPPKKQEYPPANPASLCESVYRKVTGQPSIPADDKRDDALRNLEAILESYFWKIDDKMIDEGKQVFAQWCSTQSKSTGRNYSKLNTAWLKIWLEQLAPVPEATHGIGQQTDLERAMARIHAAAQER